MYGNSLEESVLLILVLSEQLMITPSFTGTAQWINLKLLLVAIVSKKLGYSMCIILCVMFIHCSYNDDYQ